MDVDGVDICSWGWEILVFAFGVREFLGVDVESVNCANDLLLLIEEHNFNLPKF